MRKMILLLHIAFWIIPCASAQQYVWVDLTANLPDTNLYGGLGKAVFIGDNGWLTQAGLSLPRRIFYTANGGRTFSTQYLPDDAGAIGGIFMRSQKEGYIVTLSDSLGNTGKIFRSTDAQNGNWTFLGEISGSNLFTITFPPLPDSIGYIGSDLGKIFRISGSDITSSGWNNSNSDVTDLAFPVSNREGWAVAGERVLHMDSTGWTLADNHSSSARLKSVWFHDNLNGWVCGEGQFILHTVDGFTWIVQYFDGEKTLFDIEFTDLQNGWAVGTESILRTTDGGEHWSPDVSGIANIIDLELHGISVTNSSTAYAAGVRKRTQRPVFLKFMTITGIENRGVPEFTFLPNPAGRVCMVRWTGFRTNNAKAEIMDLSGRMKSEILIGSDPSGEKEFDISALQVGVYLVKMHTGESVIFRKLVVVR